MPTPDSTPAPTPPIIGFYGKPLNPDNGGSEFKEKTPEGGFILWQKRDDGDWRPVKYLPPEKGTEV